MTNVCGAGVLLRYTFDDSSSFHMRFSRASRNQNDSLASFCELDRSWLRSDRSCLGSSFSAGTRAIHSARPINFAGPAGRTAAIAAGISTYTYHPRSDKTVANSASVRGTSIGYDTAALVAKEFWPDIRRRLRKNKNKEVDQPTATAQKQ
jgi:hypothetical protein